MKEKERQNETIWEGTIFIDWSNFCFNHCLMKPIFKNIMSAETLGEKKRVYL